MKQVLTEKKRGKDGNTLEGDFRGRLGGSAVQCLPLAQGVILESQDRVLYLASWASCMEPASPSASVYVSVSHE